MVTEKALAFAYACLATFEEDTALLAAVWRRWCKTTGHRRKSPLLDVRFNEDEAHLTKIDLDVARSIRADCWEEVLTLETVCDIFQLLSIACEEDRAGPWSVAYTYNISLLIYGRILRPFKRLVVSSLSGRRVRDREFVQSFIQSALFLDHRKFPYLVT